MDARIQTPAASAAIPRDAVRPVRRRRHDEDEHEFQDELSRQAGEQPQRNESVQYQITPERPAVSEADVGTQLDVIG